MKVLQINSVCGVGSTGRIATDLYKVLEEYGHKCKIAYGRGNAPEDIDTIKIGTNFDNYLHVFKTRMFDEHGFGSVDATKKFIEEVKQYDPDIIHLHNIHGYYINIEILFEYLSESNKPVIWTLHDCWAFTGHCSHFDYISCNKWKKACGKCPQKNEYPSSKLLDNSYSNYVRKKELFTSLKNMIIVTPSKWLANLVEKSFLGKYQVKVINNGIDLDVFKPTESNFRNQYGLKDKFIILGVSNIWNEKKGLRHFLELENELSDEYKIVLVGIKEKQIGKVSDKILAINKTNNCETLAEIYTAADVFLNPTLEDTFPTTNIESLACGTPIITFNVGGSVECIDNKVGIICNDKSAISLSGYIKSIKNQKINFNKINCRDKAKNSYDKWVKFTEYINLYKCNYKMYYIEKEVTNESSIYNKFKSSI